MKLYFKILFTAFAIIVSSCNITEMDLLDSPNAVSPENAQIDFVYNSIQQDFESFFTSSFFLSAGPARMIAMTGGFTYNDAFSPTSYNFLWRTAYAGLFPDINAVVTAAEENSLDIHAGSAMIMKAYVLVTLVDLFGDIPYSEALQGTDIISPNADNGEDVYAVAVQLLDDAIARISGNPEAAKPAIDILFGGDGDKWVRLANTLKLKIALQTRLVDSGAGAKIDAAIAAGVIESSGDDFQFEYGTNRSNPNSRHPFYNNFYESNDGTYQSNYFMWLLLDEKPLTAGSDPRIRFYFYRQDLDLSDEDVNVWSCIWSDEPDPAQKPAHYTAVDPNMPYCVASINGYFGRDHGNGSGIPPDGPIRTVWGVYPAGGLFDDNSQQFTQERGTLGALGQGIQPIMLSSFVWFMRAEAALMAGTGDDPRTMLQNGIEDSMDKVFSFSDKVDGSIVVGSDPVTGDPLTLKEVYLDPLPGLATDYVNDVMAMYDATTTNNEKLEIIIKEYLIALYGNGIEAYNNLRRTSMPSNVQPTIDSKGGSFIWSAWYPADYVNLNQNADQKSIDDKIFWDTSAGDAVR